MSAGRPERRQHSVSQSTANWSASPLRQRGGPRVRDRGGRVERHSTCHRIKQRRHYAALMRMGLLSSRIHMRMRAHWGQRNGYWRHPMSVIPSDTVWSAAGRAAKPRSFWQAFAQALDRFVAYRIKRTMPEVELRRSEIDIDRCRRLMLHGSIAPAPATLDPVRARRAATMVPTHS